MTAIETTNEVLRKTIDNQDCKITELSDSLNGVDEAVQELQNKYPNITQKDLDAIKQPLENSIRELNNKMALVFEYLKLKTQ